MTTQFGFVEQSEDTVQHYMQYDDSGASYLYNSVHGCRDNHAVGFKNDVTGDFWFTSLHEIAAMADSNYQSPYKLIGEFKGFTDTIGIGDSLDDLAYAILVNEDEKAVRYMSAIETQLWVTHRQFQYDVIAKYSVAVMIQNIKDKCRW